MEERTSIRHQMVGLSMRVVLVAILLSTGATLGLTLMEEYRHMEENLTDLSMLLSRTPVVRGAMRSEEQGALLNALLVEMVEDVESVDLVAAADAGGTVRYAPDAALVGAQLPEEAVSVLREGEEVCIRSGGLVADTERGAYAAVREEDGTLIGVVFAGMYRRSVAQLVVRTVLQFLCVAAAAAVVAGGLAVQRSKRIKKALLGHEPDAFARLFLQRQDILEALEEGILAIDRDSRVIYLNAAAARMLSIGREQAVGKLLREVYPCSTMDRILQTGRPEYNVSLESLKHVRVLSDRVPIREGKEIAGAVGIFRNRTEVTRLAEDLTGVRHMVDALRAYTHEFMNKLHVILGLLQLGETQKAQQYIMDTTRIQQEAVGRITRCIRDPSVAALLVGKASHCAELGIRFTLDGGSSLTAGGSLPPEACITLLGNLIENAADCLNQSPREEKEITVAILEEDDSLLVCVEDNGPGIAPDLKSQMFQPGVSTKGKDRGTGLALVREVVEAYRGQIRVESEPGMGTSFFVTFRRKAEKEEG
ncbi:Spo0B domain-containing protein [Pseudoflavonifractor phocaeensis]|uniref:sensor histidine kinase n=1 Tax=Pseudoflavonifractor phocaeensis TaxID=1870988 RepID=UPI00195EEF4F|nr:ATP-binding protein [Pseudoflavonifractor phocaeensis]MBM6937502.1 Spo0B domain-containing protein [Pseudoflavonifractor phocaeensis]